MEELKADTTPNFWTVKLDGICPNGQTRCHEGGLQNARGRQWGAVRGGARNCALCRFFMTGPMFLSGQVVAINALLYKIREMSNSLIEKYRQVRAEDRGSRRRAFLQMGADELESEINVLIESLQARHRLLVKSTAMANSSYSNECKNENTRKSSLIVRNASYVTSSLSDVSDLRFLDAVTRAFVIFPETDCDSASVRRNVLIDKLLDRDGFEACLFRLPAGLARSTGSELLDLMTTLAGDETLDRLEAGEITMNIFGRGAVEEILNRGLGEATRLIEDSSFTLIDSKD